MIGWTTVMAFLGKGPWTVPLVFLASGCTAGVLGVLPIMWLGFGTTLLTLPPAVRRHYALYWKNGTYE